MRGPVLALTLMLAAACAALPADAGPPKNPGRKPAGQSAVPPDGGTLYRAYCASCHGLDGKGGGPAAEALRMRPADLTALAARNGGRFPSRKIERLLGGEDAIAAHGSRQMPVWGPAFSSLGAAEGEPGALAARLLGYLRSIQKPGAVSAP